MKFSRDRDLREMTNLLFRLERDSGVENGFDCVAHALRDEDERVGGPSVLRRLPEDEQVELRR